LFFDISNGFFLCIKELIILYAITLQTTGNEVVGRVIEGITERNKVVPIRNMKNIKRNTAVETTVGLF